MIEPLTIILLALVGLCLVVMWGYFRRLRISLDTLWGYCHRMRRRLDKLEDHLDL